MKVRPNFPAPPCRGRTCSRSPSAPHRTPSEFPPPPPICTTSSTPTPPSSSPCTCSVRSAAPCTRWWIPAPTPATPPPPPSR